uniref:Uncharacterized protein n=1 Tax=Nelumbo nucifera TaxID=4432 RepID=A0A822Y4A4_NELNU|nr:TPA_asm: hypothetical protein HUJ06_027607 [Nelumbo nucifera]
MLRGNHFLIQLNTEGCSFPYLTDDELIWYFLQAPSTQHSTN